MQLSSLVRATLALSFVTVSSPSRSASAQVDGPESGRVVAVFGEARLVVADLDQWWRERDAQTYFRAQHDVYDGRRRALDALLADHLLSAEADRRGLTIESLVSQEVARRTRPVTAGDVSAFLEANPLPAGATESAVAPAIVALLGQRAREAAAEEYIRSLRRASPTLVQVMLEPPRASIPPASHSPTMGPASARVTVVEFSDFECPFCRKAAPMISRLRERFSTEVRFVWRNYPLSIHQHARLAAEAAQCAHDQGRFWAFHDELFRDPTLLPPPHLEATAARLGLDMEAFTRCLSGHVHGGDVATDVEVGEQVGVSGTPTVFINGVAFVGALSYDVYERAIVDELARTLVAEPVAETPGEVNP